MTDLVDRTEEWLSKLLDQAEQPPEGEVWTVRDKLSLGGVITNFLSFKATKVRTTGPSKFTELVNDLRQ